MQSPAMRLLSSILGIVLTMPGIAHAQAPTAAPRADVGTIADIIRVSYEVISGPAGAPRQWERDRTLYMPGATFVANNVRNGKVQTKIMTPEEYRRGSDSRFVALGLFETEVASRIERFGNVAQVRSVAVARRTTDGPIQARYVNYFQLFWDGTRWWIAGVVWDEERPDNPIPAAWLGHSERHPSNREADGTHVGSSLLPLGLGGAAGAGASTVLEPRSAVIYPS